MLLLFVVDSDFQGAQEPVVLRREFDLAGGLEGALGLRFFFNDTFHIFLFVLAILVTAVETDGGFENEEDVVTGAFDFTDRLGNPIGLGQGIVNRIP